MKEDQSKRRRVAAMPPTPVNRQPGPSTSRPLAPPPSTPNQQLQPVYPHTQAISSSPMSDNPYAALAIPPVNHYQQPQNIYPRASGAFQGYYPYYYYPPNTPSTASQQPPNPFYYPYPYPRQPPQAPPPPNS